MTPLDYLHLQLRLEGKEVINGSLLRQVEVVPDEEMPLMVIASLASNKLSVYYDETLPSDLLDKLNEQVHSLSFPNIESIINTLQSHNFKLEIGHYKTYTFPEHYKDSEADEVMLYSQSDHKIQAFGFGGFTEQVHAIERDGKIVSACVSAKENDHCGEAWVFTDQNYRHQGLAQKVVSIWAGDLQLTGKVPLYSHRIQNNTSANLAKQLRLHPIFEEIAITRLAV